MNRISDLAVANSTTTNQKQNKAFELIGLKKLHNDFQFSQIDGSGLAVAVIDTGINSQHSLLKNNYKYGYDFLNGDGDPEDLSNHGTDVAGIIGANDPEIGVAPEVDLIALKVGSSSSLSYQSILNALQWVLDHHNEYNIVAVNLSFGGGLYTSESQVSYFDSEYNLVQKLEREGITVVASAGNSYYGTQYQNIAAPAIYSTLAVGSVWTENVGKREWVNGAIDYTTGADRIVSFSQRLNSNNMIFAPGAEINSTSSDGNFSNNNGTSFAAPHVTGAVALIQEAALEFAGRKFTSNEVAQIIRSTAQSIRDGDDENDNVTNTNISYLRLNIYNAVVATQAQGYKEIIQYCASYGDLIATFGYNLNAFAKHYRDFGEKEGRSRDQFDEFRYIASYSDLIIVFKIDGEKATQHYIQAGYKENRLITFDVSRYLASNTDLIQSLNKDRQAATKHYIQNGYSEQRSTTTFAPKQYLASYPDLLAAFGVNLAVATEHFVNSGYQEQRSSDHFDEYRYLASYPDLIQTFRTNGDAATDHYLTYGIAEKRSVTFDPFSYISLNPDIALAYGNNSLEATKHYINYGYDEQRRIF